MTTLDALFVATGILQFVIAVPFAFADATKNFMARGTEVRAKMVRLRNELRPFVFPSMFMYYLLDSARDTSMSNRVVNALLMLVWAHISYRRDDDNDDRWTKRRKRLRNKLSIRLSVPMLVPQKAGS